MFLRSKATSVVLVSAFTLTNVMLPTLGAVDQPGKVEFQTGYPQGVNSQGMIPPKVKVFGKHTLPTGTPAWSHWGSLVVYQSRAAGSTASNAAIQELNGALGQVSGGICTEAVYTASVGSFDVWLVTTWTRWTGVGVQETQSKKSSTETVNLS